MNDVKLQDWPEGKRLRITYCHGKDEPRAITSYAGKWHFFEPVRVEIEPHPEGFYIPARDYDRQAAEITRLRDLVKETGDLAALRAAEITRLCAELTTAQKYRDAVDVMLKERCNSPVRDHETPLRALQRLITFELTTMALDPKIHKGINDALATARREGMEKVLRIIADFSAAFSRPECCGNGLGGYTSPPECCGNPLYLVDVVELQNAIRAAAQEGKP